VKRDHHGGPARGKKSPQLETASPSRRSLGSSRLAEGLFQGVPSKADQHGRHSKTASGLHTASRIVGKLAVLANALLAFFPPLPPGRHRQHWAFKAASGASERPLKGEEVEPEHVRRRLCRR